MALSFAKCTASLVGSLAFPSSGYLLNCMGVFTCMLALTTCCVALIVVERVITLAAINNQSVLHRLVPNNHPRSHRARSSTGMCSVMDATWSFSSGSNFTGTGTKQDGAVVLGAITALVVITDMQVY